MRLIPLVLLAAGLGLAFSAIARAGDDHDPTLQFYDRQNRPDGRAETHGSNTQYYNSRNEPVGRAVQDGNRICTTIGKTD